jgi:AraC-like DNA-binding protein
MSEFFIQKRLQSHKYVRQVQAFPFYRYQNEEGWTDSILNQELVFSHRNTWYTSETFTEKLHAHDYYELTIYVKGDVEYVNENTLISVSPYTVVWFKPGHMHTTRLLADSQYERYLLYFSTDFFSIGGKNTPITNFMEHSATGSLTLSQKNITELTSVLKRIDKTLTCNKSYKELLVNALLIELFDLLNSSETEIIEGVKLDDTTSQIKQYVDTHYATITSVNEIAEHFFHSPNYLSNIFSKEAGITLKNYMITERIERAKKLLANPNMKISTIAAEVGYKSTQHFSTVFSNQIGMTPTSYRNTLFGSTNTEK